MKATTTFLATALSTAIVAACMTYLPAANANLRLNATGGTVCKAASGPGAAVFYFSNLYAENTSATIQYLTCAIPDIHETSELPSIVEIGLQNTKAVSAQFTCVIQNGWIQSGYTVNTATYVQTAVANGYSNVEASAFSTPALPARSSTFSPYSLSCAMPTGGRLGLVTTSVTGTKA